MDRLITAFDNAMRTLHHIYGDNRRPSPASGIEAATLSENERKHAVSLLRVDHVGEICAQALYQGQALTADDEHIRQHMLHAADEESDHLDWCKQRLDELHGRSSVLNPLWYVGALTIGAVAGFVGKEWNLGFVAETEKQVEAHLDEHLEQLPQQDERSRAILRQMRADEMRHADQALQAGGKPLPKPISKAMRFMSKVMTTTAYYI